MTRRDLLALVPTAFLRAREFKTDILIAGGSTGGVAAAIAACRNGMSVIMTEETRWIGGQLTSQFVPPDEHPWIESFGGTALYRSYRRDVRNHYRAYFPLTAEIRAIEDFNPGGGSVSRITHEPRVSLAVLEAKLLPYIGAGLLTVLTEHDLVAADVQGNRVRSVTVRSRQTGNTHTVSATYFLDATEQGDLLPLTKTEFVTGFESRKDTGEPHAPEVAQPDNIQSFTVCFPLAYDNARPEPIERPREYTFWRDYIPKLKPAWPGKLLSWTMSHPVTLELRKLGFNPEPPYTTGDGSLNLWLYRRIAAREHFAPGAYKSDITLVNWPQNDYWLGNLHNVSKEESTRHLERAKQLSLSLLYWMQTEAGFPGLHLRPDQTGTEDGLAMYPYIRESRRIRAEVTVAEQHVGTEARMKLTGKPREEAQAEQFADSVGVGSYRIDLHPSSGGDNYIDISSLPFQIPLGALLPVRMENLIPACKNLGVTHITNGCYRLHPVEWNIGESAGCLAAAAIRQKVTPRAIRNDKKLLAGFQQQIRREGIETEWPRLSPR